MPFGSRDQLFQQVLGKTLTLKIETGYQKDSMSLNNFKKNF